MWPVVAALAYALPHAVYHSAHIDEFDDRLDQVALAVSLWGIVALAAIVAVGRIRPAATQP